MAPLGVAAIVVAGFCVQQTRWIWATIAIAVGMMEPQLALPAALACFVAFAPMRLPLTIVGCALALLSVAVAGPAQTVQYLTSIIPAHALAEVSRDNQYSLATIVAAAGVPDAAATLIGSLSYVVMTVLGILVGRKLARHYDEPAFVMLHSGGIFAAGRLVRPYRRDCGGCSGSVAAVHASGDAAPVAARGRRAAGSAVDVRDVDRAVSGAALSGGVPGLRTVAAGPHARACRRGCIVGRYYHTVLASGACARPAGTGAPSSADRPASCRGGAGGSWCLGTPRIIRSCGCCACRRGADCCS